jgi:hypothetical protein
MPTFDAYEDHAHTEIVDGCTYIHARAVSDRIAVVNIGSVTIRADRATLDRLHEVVTVAYELLDQHVFDTASAS